MKAQDPFSGYSLVATRIDQETGMKYEIHAKRDMTEAQVDEQYAAWMAFVKEKVSSSSGIFKIWVEEAAFDIPNDKSA